MSKKGKTALVPKLRFQEFSSSGEWKVSSLHSLAVKITNKNKERSITRILTNSAIDGVVDQSEYFEREIVTQSNIDNYFVIDEGDYVYNPRISTSAPVGPISKNKIGKGIMSPLYTVFRFNNPRNDFYEQYFKTNLWNSYLKTVSNTGARHDRISISTENFMSMPLPYPSGKEQQKIADCLSSLDSLIAAEDKKLAALKLHKKGLMQKLFPAEGKTLPEWRFPEFRDCGEWALCQIKDFAKVTTGNKDTQNKVDNGEYPFFVRSQTVEKIDTYTFDCEAILTSGDGVGVGKNFHYIVGKFDFHQRVYCIYDFKNSVIGKFVYQYFSENFQKRVMQLSAKNSVDSVRMSMITDMPICMPKLKEQQKIADCLSNADEVITAQEEKIKALKIHKKGLMQGLFPSIDEVGE